MHFEPDPSHVEEGDGIDASAHQNIPVVGPGQDTVLSQNLEVTASIMFISLYGVLLSKV